MKTGTHSIFSRVLMILLMVFFYAPIIYAIVFSFNSTKSLTTFTGFSLQWYDKMFNDRNAMEAVMYTVIVAVLATIISTVAGTITAIGLSRSQKALKNVVNQVNELPIMNPDIVTGIGVLMLFSTLHINKGFTTMLLAHIMFCTPYVILSIAPRLKGLDPNLCDAAMDLGATPWQAMTKVVVPQIMPGIISGALIAFTMSFDDFVISYFATGNGVSNISILVYTMTKRINPTINALATLVIVVISVFLIVGNVLVPLVADRKRQRQERHEQMMLSA